MAATRIKVSKLRFLVGAFRGKQWEEDELFFPEDSVREEAAETLRRYHATIKVNGKGKSGWGANLCTMGQPSGRSPARQYWMLIAVSIAKQSFACTGASFRLTGMHEMPS